MAKPGVKSRPRGSRAGDVTRAQIVQAALETLRTEGFAGSSARAIGRTGGFNHALIFYHFGSVPELLLAALDATSGARLARYLEAMGEARSLPDILRLASDLYREDVESGHIAVLAEIVAGSSSLPELRRELAARVEPWLRFTEETLQRFLGTSPLAALVPPADLAFAVVASYVGLELLSHMEGDRARGVRLLSLASSLADIVGPLLAPPEQEADHR